MIEACIAMKKARKGKGREWLFSCPWGLACGRIESHCKPLQTAKPASGWGGATLSDPYLEVEQALSELEQMALTDAAV
jgi:hypothetical protein